MSRYITPPSIEMPRRKVVPIDVSDPAYPVPDWALNGIVYVSGTAPGAGGGNRATAGERGGGGGAGGYCMNVPMRIGGAATIAVAIGAPSDGAAGSSGATAANAGDTTVTVGPCVLTLQGGKGGASPSGGGGGFAVVGSLTGLTLGHSAAPFGITNGTSQGLGGTPSPLASGAAGGPGNVTTQGWGAGAMSPFGGGGLGLASAPAANAPGANGTGYGAGGAGSNGSGAAGAGAPSIVWLEFVEVTA